MSCEVVISHTLKMRLKAEGKRREREVVRASTASNSSVFSTISKTFKHC